MSLVGTRVRAVIRSQEGQLVQLSGTLTAGSAPGWWQITDSGGAVFQIEQSQIDSIVAATGRSPSPEQDSEPARQRLLLLQEQRAAATVAEERAHAAESQREQLRIATLSASTAAAEREAAAELQREHLRQATVAAATAAEDRELRAAEERRSISTRMEQMQQQQQQHATQQQQVLAGLAETLRALSERLSRSNSPPQGSRSPLPRQEHTDGALFPPPPPIIRSTTGSGAGASMGSASSLNDNVAIQALRLMGEQARREKPWRCSHELTTEEGFTALELEALKTVPPYGWPKDDENSNRLMRAMRGIAKHLLKYATTPVNEVIEKLRMELANVRKTLGPTWVGGLQFLLLADGGETYARVSIAELALTTDSDAPDDLIPRLVLARTMCRSDKAESAKIMAAKSKTISNVGDLPLQLRERISKWA